MTQISACVGKVVFPPPLSAQTVLWGKKPSTHVVPGYPGHAWLLPWQPAAYRLDLSPWGLRRTGGGPPYLQTWGEPR